MSWDRTPDHTFKDSSHLSLLSILSFFFLIFLLCHFVFHIQIVSIGSLDISIITIRYLFRPNFNTKRQTSIYHLALSYDKLAPLTWQNIKYWSIDLILFVIQDLCYQKNDLWFCMLTWSDLVLNQTHVCHLTLKIRCHNDRGT